ncbi:hypothetical protein HPY31_24550 [Brevibacillus sp. HB1.3]|uniref:hypothetical protein n=1 Tax=Brevibacillus sp. HB1.3 TaxID=2738842 RepID=UPI0015564562|nr:hypothetical protein [Brevibacillus sp. HB1.3]NQF17045.1 hypothetical protein [Brevibacillus sp. HB1.3]
MKNNLMIPIVCFVGLVAGCSQPSQLSQEPASQQQQMVKQEVPQGFIPLTLTEENKTKIMADAEKFGIQNIYVPLFVREGLTLQEISGSEQTKQISLRFENEQGDQTLEISLSPQEVLLGGAVIQQQETKLDNGTPAKWISFSNHKENVEAAVAELYFQLNSTYVALSNDSSQFEKEVEQIASALQLLKK